MVGGIVLGAAALAGVAALVSLSPDPVEIDPDTLCPAAGPAAVTAILVDTTDRIGALSRTDILGRLADLAATSRTAELFLVYDTKPVDADLPGDGNPFPPMLGICNPGSGEDVSEWTGNPALVRRRFEEGFRQPVERRFADLVHLGKPADQSPLMENIQAISVTVLARREYAGMPKRLIVVSDLLQHSGHASLYRGVPDYDVFAATAGAQALRTNLRDVQVRLLFVERREHERLGSARRLVDFWDRWIADQGGGVTRVSRVDGLN